MLWDAAQTRLARDSRSRRAELFEAVRDAHLAADISVGRVKPRGGYRKPPYLDAERDPEAARRDLARLVAERSHNVSRAESAAAMRQAFQAQVRPEDRTH
jgi:hypothetical protein